MGSQFVNVISQHSATIKKPLKKKQEERQSKEKNIKTLKKKKESSTCKTRVAAVNVSSEHGPVVIVFCCEYDVH
jgi:hypothetical protein